MSAILRALGASLSALAWFCGSIGAAQGQSSVEVPGCAPAGARGFAVAAGKDGTPVRGFLIGEGTRAVVFSNTAVGGPCNWLDVAQPLAARGFVAAMWSYAGAPGVHQTAQLRAVVEEVVRRGARQVVLVGGSRGGCLSMMAASEIGPPVAGVAILSCARVFNRMDPVPVAPWAQKLRVPVLHLTGEQDSVPPVSEAKADFERFAVADKTLTILPGTGSHGDALLRDREHGAAVRQALIDFAERVAR